MNEQTQPTDATTTLIHKAVKFALDGKRNESWTSRHQLRAIAFVIADENGGDVNDYLKSDNVLSAAVKFFGNASANRQTLEKANVIDQSVGGKGAKRTNMFAGYEN